MMWTRCVASSVVVFALVADYSIAAAEQPAVVTACTEIPVCRERLQAAQLLAKTDRAADALREYLALYSEFGDPRLCFSIGRLLQRQGKHRKAIAFYERDLAAGVETDPDKVEKTKRFLEEARAAAQQEEGGVPASTDAEPAASSQTSNNNSGTAQEATPATQVRPMASAVPPVVTLNEARETKTTIHTVRTERVLLYRRWWFWTTIGVATAGVVVGAALAAYAQEPSWPEAPQLRPYP